MRSAERHPTMPPLFCGRLPVFLCCGADHAHQHSHEHTGDDCGICKTGQMQDHQQGEGHSHAHEHGHAHTHEERQETTAANRFGIRSFVYSRRTPFHPQRWVHKQPSAACCSSASLGSCEGSSLQLASLKCDGGVVKLQQMWTPKF